MPRVVAPAVTAIGVPAVTSQPPAQGMSSYSSSRYPDQFQVLAR